MPARSEMLDILDGRPPLRILVVDDDDSMRMFCASLLRRNGFEVIEAKDGREGIARAVSELPDLVVCDISMPVLGGFGVAEALRENEQTRDVPIVFLTGETEPEVEAHAHSVGARGFFTKPFPPGALCSFIRNALVPVSPSMVGSIERHAS